MTRILGLVRFSVLIEGPRSPWNLGRRPGYRDNLFSDARLRKRFQLFENITLPSLDAQSEKHFKILLFTSSAMPPSWRKKLEILCRDRPYLNIIEVRPNDNFYGVLSRSCEQVIPADEPYVTFRLDDDDALYRRYIETLTELNESEVRDRVISFDNGIYIGARADRGGLLARTIQYRCLGLGLAYRGSTRPVRTIFHLGNHVKLRKDPTLKVVTDPHTWLRARYQEADSFMHNQKLVGDFGGHELEQADLERIVQENFPENRISSMREALLC